MMEKAIKENLSILQYSSTTAWLAGEGFCISYLKFSPCFLNRITAYSIKAPNKKRMQANIQASMAVRPLTLGVIVATELKMVTSTRKSMARSVILPGTMSKGRRKEIQETITHSPEGR